jgi:hypothetical protein
MRTSLIGACAALSILASCSPMRERVQPIGPSWNEKQVDVDLVQRGGKTEIAVREEPVIWTMDKRAVIWSLRASASNYKFTSKGVLPVQPSTKLSLPAECQSLKQGDPKDLQCAPAGEGGRLFRCTKVANSSKACYAYAVQLEPRSGGAPIDLDPWIMSE